MGCWWTDSQCCAIWKGFVLPPAAVQCRVAVLRSEMEPFESSEFACRSMKAENPWIAVGPWDKIRVGRDCGLALFGHSALLAAPETPLRGWQLGKAYQNAPLLDGFRTVMVFPLSFLFTFSSLRGSTEPRFARTSARNDVALIASTSRFGTSA